MAQVLLVTLPDQGEPAEKPEVHLQELLYRQHPSERARGKTAESDTICHWEPNMPFLREGL